MKIDFSFNTDKGGYKDSLYLPDNHQFSEEDIEKMKQERLVIFLNSFSGPFVPTDEDPNIISDDNDDNILSSIEDESNEVLNG